MRKGLERLHEFARNSWPEVAAFTTAGVAAIVVIRYLRYHRHLNEYQVKVLDESETEAANAPREADAVRVGDDIVRAVRGADVIAQAMAGGFEEEGDPYSALTAVSKANH